MTLQRWSVMLFCGVLCLLPMGADAQESVAEATAAYQYGSNIETLNVSVPTVVGVGIATSSVLRELLVLDTTTQTPIPSLLTSRLERDVVDLQLTANGGSLDWTAAFDADALTAVTVPVSVERRTDLIITNPEAVTWTELHISFTPGTTLPSQVSVRTGQRVQVVRPMTEQMNIPVGSVSSDTLQVTFVHDGPISVADVEPLPLSVAKKRISEVRFLALPNHTYRLYAVPDRTVSVSLPEAGNLHSDTGVIMIDPVPLRLNPTFIPVDTDEDGVPDATDNCVSYANPNQLDIDKNGQGDACDDFDRDDVVNARDNCPDDPNKRQSDKDGDGLGDACDEIDDRLSEQLPWLPWVGIGFACLVLISLFVLVLVQKHEEQDGVE